ncbi:DoxX family protein [Streptosporangium sp. KLBMP 9127]|nr:DoxX family protein [Streptosporangium sp. KLBMP 9127]
MRRTLYDIAALIARVIVGVIFVAHGWQKMSIGWGPISNGFTQLGVPLPQLAAGFTMVAELLGGVLLILGLLTPLAGLALVLVCVGAAVFVHGRNGVFVDEGGWELVGGLGSAALLLAAGGAGRFSLDHLMFGRRRERAHEVAPAPSGEWYGGAESSASAGPESPPSPASGSLEGWPRSAEPTQELPTRAPKHGREGQPGPEERGGAGWPEQGRPREGEPGGGDWPGQEGRPRDGEPGGEPPYRQEPPPGEEPPYRQEPPGEEPPPRS